jgi:multicomponent Na+:H+ antiporter subunit F
MTVVGIICAVLLGLSGVLCLIRVVRGPSMLDRTVATDVFVAAIFGAVGVHAAVGRYSSTVSVLLVLSLVGFLGSVSIARFAARDGDGSPHLEEGESS